MPAYNMAQPRSTATDPSTAPVSNPNAGSAVIMSPFSGPKGSPFDAMKYPTTTYQPVLADRVTAGAEDASTGALSTGIGYGLNTDTPGIGALFSATDPAKAGFFPDDYVPGVTKPDGTSATDATLQAIGGGRSVITPGTGSDYSKGTSSPSPYNALPILAFGSGASRDAGAGPAFTGFGMKVVTAASDVAIAGVIETGFTNRQGAVLKSGQSQFGSNGTASTAPA